MSELKIRWKGEDLILIGNQTEGAITTPDRFEVFADSVAHLYPDGKIRCYGEVVGTREDIEFLGDCGELHISDEGFTKAALLEMFAKLESDWEQLVKETSNGDTGTDG